MTRQATRVLFFESSRILAAVLAVWGMVGGAVAEDSSRSTSGMHREEWSGAEETHPRLREVEVAVRSAVPRPPADLSGSSAGQPRGNPMRPRRSSAKNRRPAKTMIARAAYGEVLSEPVPPVLEPSLHGGHSIACDGCGDCASCDACPTCGVEAACGLEVGCGVEGYACGAAGCATCGGHAAPAYGAATGFPSSHRTGGVECVPFFLPILPIDWCRFEFFGGVHGFSGPPNFPTGLGATDRVGTGSFGFHQGLNEGRSLAPLFGVDWGAQLGVRATQNNLNGAAFTGDDRNQFFVTGGFFRRVDYGLQMGLVLDYLNDDWYYHTDLTQLRGELSWKFGGCHEIGYRVMGGGGESSSATSLIDDAGDRVVGMIALEATDQHRFFYRRNLGGDGLLDAFLGTTDHEDTVLGMAVDTPLRGRLGLKTGFAYLNPSEGSGAAANRNESWNVSLSVVWRPCGRTGKCDGYYKPLFDVADNGSFMVDRR